MPNWDYIIVRALNKAGRLPDTDPQKMELIRSAIDGMTRASVEDSLITTTTSTKADNVVTVVNYPIIRPYAQVKTVLLRNTAEAFGCVVVIAVRTDGYHATITGLSKDVQRFETLYTFILSQLLLSMQRTVLPLTVNPKSYKRQWLLSRVLAINALVNTTVRRALYSAPNAHIAIVNRAEIMGGRHDLSVLR